MSDQTSTLRAAFCWTILVAWTANLVAGMIPAWHYTPNLTINAPMMLVLGALLYDVTHPRGVEGNRRGKEQG